MQFTNIIMDSQGLTDLSTEDSKASFRDRLSGLQDSVKRKLGYRYFSGTDTGFKSVKRG